MGGMKKRKQAWPDRSVIRRKSASTSTEESMPFLPEEIVMDILVKLPAKTLLRFKCLSTRIHNLTQSPNFVAAHAEHQRVNHTGIFLLARSLVHTQGKKNTNNSSTVCRFSLPFLKSLNKYSGLKCVGSWNGLVCLNYPNQDRMILWNPATSRFCFGPPPMIRHDSSSCNKNTMVYGFGYDSVSDDYKSVKFVTVKAKDLEVQGSIEAEVLSWGKRSWKRLKYEKESCLDYERIFCGIQPDTSVTSKGRVNWRVSYSGMLLSFKFDEEKFELISPPPNARFGDVYTACAWKGSLGMLVQNGSRTAIWLFNDDDQDQDHSCCWSKLLTVETDYTHWWVGEPEGVYWRTDYIWNSFLVYPYDDCVASKFMSGGNVQSRAGFRIERGFEFAATLVPVPGSASYATSNKHSRRKQRGRGKKYCERATNRRMHRMLAL